MLYIPVLLLLNKLSFNVNIISEMIVTPSLQTLMTASCRFGLLYSDMTGMLLRRGVLSLQTV